MKYAMVLAFLLVAVKVAMSVSALLVLEGDRLTAALVR